MECNWFKLWMTTQKKEKNRPVERVSVCITVYWTTSNNNNKKRQTNKQQAHNQNDSNPLNVFFILFALRAELSRITCCALNCQFGLVCGCVPNVHYYHQQMIINLWIKWLFHLLLRIYHATNDVVSCCAVFFYTDVHWLIQLVIHTHTLAQC